MPRDFRHRRPAASGGCDGDEPGRGQYRRSGESPFARRFSAPLCGRSISFAGANPGAVRRKGLVHGGRFQTRNPMHRSPEHLVKACRRTLRRRSGPFAARAAQARGRAGRSEHARNCRAARAIFPGRHGAPGRLSARHALRRPAGSAAARAVSARTTAAAISSSDATTPGWTTSCHPRRAADIRRSPPGALKIQAVKIDQTFWCYRCGGMASARTCPQTRATGSSLGCEAAPGAVRGRGNPAEFSRPEVLQVLREYYGAVQGPVKTASQEKAPGPRFTKKVLGPVKNCPPDEG